MDLIEKAEILLNLSVVMASCNLIKSIHDSYDIPAWQIFCSRPIVTAQIAALFNRLQEKQLQHCTFFLKCGDLGASKKVRVEKVLMAKTLR